MRIQVAASALLVVILGLPSLADDEPSAGDKALSAKGLTRSHGIYSLDEKDLGLKYDLLKEAKRAYLAKLNDQAAYKQGDQNLADLGQMEKNLQAEINGLNRVGNSGYRYRGRVVNSAQREMIQEANFEKMDAQGQLNYVRQQKAMLQKSLPNAQKRKEIDSDVTTRRTELVSAITELKSGIDDMRAKYQELADDTEVKAALESARQGSVTRPKVGLSKAMQTAEQEMTKLGRQLHVPGFAPEPHKKVRGKSAKS